MAAGETPRRVERGDPGYPVRLEGAGGLAPARLTLRGEARLLDGPLVGLLCSVRVPGGCVLPALDTAAALGEAGVGVVGGFHSPVERECLDLLLQGKGPVVICPARSIEAMRLPRAWGAALDEGRLLVVSSAAVRRPTAALAEGRNRLVAGLASALVVVHAAPGGRLMRLAGMALARGTPVYCPGLPENRDLLLAGAAELKGELSLLPIPPAEALLLPAPERG